jgi:hypothetical protein
VARKGSTSVISVFDILWLAQKEYYILIHNIKTKFTREDTHV